MASVLRPRVRDSAASAAEACSVRSLSRPQLQPSAPRHLLSVHQRASAPTRPDRDCSGATRSGSRRPRNHPSGSTNQQWVSEQDSERPSRTSRPRLRSEP
uniref:Uncharacterized protein n=1 Tax=Pararge aegeria TaxID=116150 RepID=S4PT48_9NEOP